MVRYHWSRLTVELHVKSFTKPADDSGEKISEERIKQYFFTPRELEAESTVFIPGKNMLDYILTVQSMDENEVILFDAMRSNDEMINMDSYQSKGVLILHEGDSHKTPTRNLSYDTSYWYEVKLV